MIFLFSEILKTLRKNKQLTQAELSKRLNVSQQTIGAWEVGRSEPSSEGLKEIANFFNVSVDYLIGATHELLDNNIYVSNKPKIYVPVLNVAAGTFRSDDCQYDDEFELPEKFSHLEDKCFAIHICGESMNKILPNGSIILCEDISKTGYIPQNNDIVVCESDREYTVKRLVETSTLVILEPNSTEPSFEPMIFKKDDEFLNLNVVGVVRRSFIDFD